MRVRTVGLIGAVAGLAAMGSAHAATSPASNAADALEVGSYAELLTPVPNAAALLRADAMVRMQRQPASPELQLAQYDGPPPRSHHHHHHHHHVVAQRHHHHHHHTTVVGVPGVGVVIGNR